MILKAEEIKGLLPKRTADSNKGTYGKLLVIAGRKECAGCAILSALAALRSGLGMVKVISAKSNFTALMNAVPEALFSSKTDEAALEADVAWADAILMGPGIGTGKKAEKLLSFVLDTRGIPVVIDADGINLLSQNDYLREALKTKAAADTVIMTPHLMEMSRFAGLSVSDIKKSMTETAVSIAKTYSITVSLKDARTITASSYGDVIINTTGNNGMSTAGSGDVLAGVIASFLTQSLSGFVAASLGVYVHGMAGDIAAERYGVRGMKAMDIAEALPELFLRIER